MCVYTIAGRPLVAEIRPPRAAMAMAFPVFPQFRRICDTEAGEGWHFESTIEFMPFPAF